MAAPTLRRELLLAFTVLFAAAALLLLGGLAILLPFLESPAQGTAVILILVLGGLLATFGFGGYLLRRYLVLPTEQMARDARRIADGDYRHRLGGPDTAELKLIRDSVNAMADRLIADQELLAENVASLEATNAELIETRDQLLQTARLASVGTLAAGIAHEVGNPLGAIIAYVDVAASRIEKEGGDTELLDGIREEARRIDRIIRGLLDYARPRDMELGPYPPSEVVRRVRALLESQGKFDGVRVEWETDTEVADVVMQPHRLEQVMVNLLLNALDAMEGTADPELRIRLAMEEGEVSRLPARRADDPPGINYMHRRRVSRDDGGKGIDPLFTARHVVVIEVADNGPGIPPDDLDRIFDPFFTTKEPGKGTGLGLSICARLVEGMGGRIEARNVDGGGACFRIRLPGTGGAAPAHADEPTRESA